MDSSAGILCRLFGDAEGGATAERFRSLTFSPGGVILHKSEIHFAFIPLISRPYLRLILRSSLILAVGLLAVAQPPGMGGGGERSLVVVPMIGTGTGADPRRPALPNTAGMAFRYVLSDDGATAIVELSGGNPLQRQKIDAELRKDSRVKVFRPSTHKKDDVEKEIRLLKKDFDLEAFGKGPAGAGLAISR